MNLFKKKKQEKNIPKNETIEIFIDESKPFSDLYIKGTIHTIKILCAQESVTFQVIKTLSSNEKLESGKYKKLFFKNETTSFLFKGNFKIQIIKIANFITIKINVLRVEPYVFIFNLKGELVEMQVKDSY
ncbi:MAG: hypothetical protein RSD14_00995 [Clostridia bacterium]